MFLHIWGKKSLRLKQSNQGFSSRECFATRPRGFVSFFSACAYPIQVILMIKVNKVIEAAVNLKSFYIFPIFQRKKTIITTCNTPSLPHAFYKKKILENWSFLQIYRRKPSKKLKNSYFFLKLTLKNTRKQLILLKNLNLQPTSSQNLLIFYFPQSLVIKQGPQPLLELQELGSNHQFGIKIAKLQINMFNFDGGALLLICIQDYSNDLYIIYKITMIEEEKKPNNFVGMHGENVGLGFVARDNAAKQQQLQNQIVFKVIRNDQNHQNLKFLLDLKNIFARQLPKMPKEYIVKLVFDRNHQSMIILRNNSKVVGGICFREFKAERFAEIAFLAITSTQQIKGFGTRLMNKLKEQMQSRRVQYLMTYADNLALGYFRKQGFSKDCRMPVERWKGYIKDYEGGTMMECFVHPTIDYSKISDIIKKQKQFVIQKIKELSINRHKFDGSKLQKMAGQPFVRRNAQGEEQSFRINPMDIPGVKESGWTWQDHEQLIKTKEVSFLLQCQNIVELLKKHQSSWPFREPVSLEDVPDYHLVVKEPIDLKTIEKKLGSSQYRDRQQFCEDINKIFKNCKIYNQPETVYFKCSNQLEEYIKPHLDALKQGNSDSLFTEKRLSGGKFNNKKKTIDKKTKNRPI